ALAACSVLLLPGTVKLARALAEAPPRTAFREAFAFVRGQWRGGGALWGSHAEVYEGYHGKGPGLMGAATPRGGVGRRARAGRLWMVYPPQPPGCACFPEVFARVRQAAGEPILHRRFPGVEVALYAPAGNRDQVTRCPFEGALPWASHAPLTA